jgi:hypothetical protein
MSCSPARRERRKGGMVLHTAVARISMADRPLKRTTLDTNNAASEGRYLHPTKGFREVSEKRTRVSIATMVLKQLPYLGPLFIIYKAQEIMAAE